MKTFFCSQDLWDVIEDGFTIPVDISTLTSAQKELKENKQKRFKGTLYFTTSSRRHNFSKNNGCHK